MKQKELFKKIIPFYFINMESEKTYNDFCNLYQKFDGNELLSKLFHNLSNSDIGKEEADCIFNFIVVCDSMMNKKNLPDQYINDLVSSIKNVDDVKRVKNEICQNDGAFESGNKIFDSKKNCFVDVHENKEPPLLLETEEVVPVQSQPEATPTRPWWKSALIGAGIGLFAVGVAVAGLALGIPALLVTTAAAIVIGAVAGAAMLIGFGIGAIVGKVREKQEKRQYQYVAIDSEDDKSPRQSPRKLPSNTSGEKLSMNGKDAKKNNAGSPLWKKPQQVEKQNNNNKPDSQPKFKN
jgi:hypothetical protein